MQKENEYLDTLYESRVDGIVVSPASDDLSHILDIGKRIPVVFAAYNPGIQSCNYVVTDDYSSAAIAVEYLIKLGHTKIAYIGGQENNNTNIGRFTGYKETLEKNGIAYNKNFVGFGQYRQSKGYQIMKDMLVYNELPTAVIAGNDIIALGVIQAIEEFGLEVPENIAVIGCDDISFAGLEKIQLTTVHQPKNQIGQMCMEMLIEKKKNFDRQDGMHKVIEPKLVIRKTCRKV